MIIFVSFVISCLLELKDYLLKPKEITDSASWNKENKKQEERRRRISSDLGLSRKSLANMDVWGENDCYDDDNWDFGDGPSKSPQEPRMKVESTRGSRQAPWSKTESFKTNPKLTAPPVKPKMIGRGGARACNVGAGFRPGTTKQQTKDTTARSNIVDETQDHSKHLPVQTHMAQKGVPSGHVPVQSQMMAQRRVSSEHIPDQTQMMAQRPISSEYFPVQSQMMVQREVHTMPIKGLGRSNPVPGTYTAPIGQSIFNPQSNPMFMESNNPSRGIGRGRGRGRGLLNTAPQLANPQHVENQHLLASQYSKLKISPSTYGTSHASPDHWQPAVSSGNQFNLGWTEGGPASVSSRETSLASETDFEKFSHGNGDLRDIQGVDASVSDKWMRKVLSAEGSPAGFQTSVPTGSEKIDQLWLNRIESFWTSLAKPSSAAICGPLHECLHSVVNPYTTALYLIENAKDFHTAKTTTLAFALTKEFDRWGKDDKELYIKCLNRDIKIQAFYIGCRANMTYFDNLVKAYRLNHEENEYFLVLIEPFMSKKKYKEAAHCVTKLGLQSHFDIKDICLPLILQDKVNMVENYVCRNSKQQVALLKLLDHLVHPETDLSQLIHDNDVPKIKRDKITKKIISKLAVRLMKLYQVPQEMCPSISNERTLKGLRYLMYRKYIEGGLGQAQWVELVQDTVAGNTMLQNHLIEQLVSYLEMNEAAKWAKYYNVPQEHIPHQIAELVQSAESIEVKPEDSEDDVYTDSTTTGRHHKLSLPAESLHWVNTHDTFYHCLDHVTLPGTTVGIDGEWKPSFGQNVVSRMALLQLATRTDVFLLDMLELGQILEENDWTHFARSFFGNADVLKLGYGIEGDLQMMVKSLPCLSDPLNQMTRVVDLQSLCNAIFQACPAVFDTDSQQLPDHSLDGSTDSPGGSTDDFMVVKTEERGLAELALQCLGRPLDKQQQLSDWERRPLRQQQINYAALDAFCLIEIYDVLIKKVQQLSLKVNLEPSISYKCKPRKTRSERKQQKVAERPEKVAGRVRMPPNPPRQTGVTVDPNAFRVVCDNMLQGLGRYLRCCGVDVNILENNDDHAKAAVIARNEDRIILTSGQPFIMLRSQVPVGYCYNVGPGKARDQVCEVLQHFNICVTPGDIFSRCQVCNGDDYLQIDAPEMREAWARKMTKLGQSDRAANFIQGQAKDSSPQKHTSNQANSESPEEYTIADFIKCDEDSDDEIIFEYDHINLETLAVGSNNVPLQVETVPEGLLQKIKVFYVCATCGKVFWEGGHFTRVREQFAHVMKNDETGTYLEKFIQGKAKLKK